MDEINKIKRNSIYSFLSIALRLIPNVLIFWILARYFGATTFGKFSYSHTLANTFLLFADFGFDLLITTEIARDRTNAHVIFQRYFWIKICLALLSLLGMLFFVFVKGGDFNSLILGLVFSFYMLFNTIANFFVASFKGFEKLNFDAKVSATMNLFLLLSSVVIFIIYPNIFLIAAVYVISRILGAVYSIVLSRTIMPKLNFKISFVGFSEGMQKAFLYGILILASSFLFQLDTILLGVFRSDYEVGVYQAVKNLLLVPFIIPGIVFSALLPTLARTFKENYAEWINLNKIFFKLVFWINIPIALVLYVYPVQIIDIIYKSKDYHSAVPVLRLFSIILFLRSTSDYLGVMLITSNRQKIHIITSLAGIILSSILCSVLIPSQGAYGAGVVYLIVISFISLVYLGTNIKIFFSYILNLRYYILIGLAAIVAILSRIYLHDKILIGLPFILILFGLLAYFYFFTEKEKKNILSVKYISSFRGNEK